MLLDDFFLLLLLLLYLDEIDQLMVHDTTIVVLRIIEIWFSFTFMFVIWLILKKYKMVI